MREGGFTVGAVARTGGSPRTAPDRSDGARTRALRVALRFTVRAFAEHLGVADRTVSKWEAAGAATFPRPDTQAMLDTVLARADDAGQQRFTSLCRGTATRPAVQDHTHACRTVPLVGDTDEVKRRQVLRLLSLSSAALAFPPASGDIEHGRVDAVAGGRAGVDTLVLAEFRCLQVHL